MVKLLEEVVPVVDPCEGVLGGELLDLLEEDDLLQQYPGVVADHLEGIEVIGHLPSRGRGVGAYDPEGGEVLTEDPGERRQILETGVPAVTPVEGAPSLPAADQLITGLPPDAAKRCYNHPLRQWPQAPVSLEEGGIGGLHHQGSELLKGGHCGVLELGQLHLQLAELLQGVTVAVEGLEPLAVLVEEP